MAMVQMPSTTSPPSVSSLLSAHLSSTSKASLAISSSAPTPSSSLKTARLSTNPITPSSSVSFTFFGKFPGLSKTTRS